MREAARELVRGWPSPSPEQVTRIRMLLPPFEGKEMKDNTRPIRPDEPNKTGKQPATETTTDKSNTKKGK